MSLRATKPQNKEKRLKMLVYGKAGVGKTLSALQFKDCYVIDCEKGTDFYANIINKNNSVVFQSVNPDEIREELHALITTKHEYKTLIIDPITQIYNAIQEKWNRIFEKHSKTAKDAEIQDYGMRYWSKVKSEYKSLQRLLLQLDMNVLVLSHEKDVYGANFSKIGTSYDAMKGEDYLYDYVFNLVKEGTNRAAITIKERAELGQNKFPERFDWTYENFCKFYGKEALERVAEVIKMATPAQVIKLTQLLDIVKIPDEIISRWMTKADCEAFSEFTEEQILGCIKVCEKKVSELNPKKEGK